GCSVKAKAFLFFLIFFSFFSSAVVPPAAASQPVDATQLAAWMTAGVSSTRLTRLVQEGDVVQISKQDLARLQGAGAEKNLIRVLSISKSSVSTGPSTPIPPVLLKAAAAAHQHNYHEAELLLRQVLAKDPQNAALHFALGAMLRQQEQLDDAFDEITESARLMPDFPENHTSLAYIFYRLDDGPNAIAEARTALSMDPQNSEAYQILGLGLYSYGQYDAAVHAFEESLASDPENADTYYDVG